MKTTNYFSNINTLDELKKAYRKLAAKLHPDNGGSKEDMQELNLQYEGTFKRVKNHRTAADGTTYTKETDETPEMFRDIIEKIITLDGLDIEIIGDWIWCTGNTYSHKDTLKTLNFQWSSRKKAWFFKGTENKNSPLSRKRPQVSRPWCWGNSSIFSNFNKLRTNVKIKCNCRYVYTPSYDLIPDIIISELGIFF